MLSTINDSWDWLDVKAIEILQVNDFGNIIFKSTEDEFWRICPEELLCERIADTLSTYESLMYHSEFVEDWEMKNVVLIAKETVGELMEGEKYCLKLPGVLGGEYNSQNIGKISHLEQIRYSGHLAKQVNDLPDGTKIVLSVE